MTPGLDGNVWYVGFGPVGRITRSGSATQFLPPTGSDEYIAVGPDGNLWFPEHQGKVGRITYQGVITEFSVLPGNPTFRGIVTGPDGNLWFADTSDNQIVRMSRTGGNVTTFPITTPNSGAWGITVGPDKNLWFAERFANQIGRLTPTGVLTEFGGLTPYPSSCAPGIGADWPGGPNAITPAFDGNLWFTEVCNGKIGRITPQGQVTEFALPEATAPQASAPWSITVGPDRNVWFLAAKAMKVGRITAAGGIREFSIPAPSTVPPGTVDYPFATGIAPGWDGRVWFGTNFSVIGAVTVS